MEKVIIWGTGRKCAMWYRWLKKYCDIVCFVNNDGTSHHQECVGVPILSIDEAVKYQFDFVVICTNPKFEPEIRNNAAIAGVSEDQIFNLDEFIVHKNLVGRYEKDCRKNQIQIIKDILAATDAEISNYDWMYKKVIEYGVFCFQNNWWTMDEEINWSVCGLQQIPEEFAQYCIMISHLQIEQAIEIGVYRGRSSYFVCAVLARKNPNLNYVLVDIEDRLDGFEEYKEVLPYLTKKIPTMSKDFCGEKYDYVFIDADHSYDASIEDFENIGCYANVIATFHDIYAHEYDGENGGTVRTWKEIVQRTPDKQHIIFSKYPDQWMGIGCVLSEEV